MHSILAVDDSASMRQMVTFTLKSAGYNVVEAVDGQDAWEKAGNIWYRTLVDKIQPQSQFQDCAQFTFEVAGTLYGANGPEQKAVKQAWAKVGVSV